MKPANTRPAMSKPIKQKYLDVFMPKPCELWRTPEQHQLSVLNLVQNGGALYVALPDDYFSKTVKPETKVAKYWKAIINTVLQTPKSLIKKYTGWKQQQENIDRLMQEVKL